MESEYHDIQQVCLDGHQITASYNNSPLFRKDCCNLCGEKTIHKCPNCNNPIKGKYHVPGVVAIGYKTNVPSYCEKCGDQFPWTSKQKQATNSENIDSMKLVEQICSRFHLIARQMKTRHSNRGTLVINDEYDTQDLLHALLHIHFDDIRSEELVPSSAGGGSRVDFLLKEEEIIIEVKKTREGLKDKHIGQELIIDIAKYQAHPNCKKLFCFVYDPEGLVKNPRGIEKDLNNNDNDFEVKVIIAP